MLTVLLVVLYLLTAFFCMVIFVRALTEPVGTDSLLPLLFIGIMWPLTMPIMLVDKLLQRTCPKVVDLINKLAFPEKKETTNETNR